MNFSKVDSSNEPKVILIAVGGPTCSGKTTLAKHLRKILPNSTILHQDDFAPSSDKIPIHPIHGLPDWDSPQGAIEWLRFRKMLRDLHSDAKTPMPPSHDALNIQPDVPIDDSRLSDSINRFKDLGQDFRFVLVDGFLLYWDKDCVEEYDVKLFVRESHDTLKERRRVRQMYHTADGQTWIDPPGYWDKIIWPAYLMAHQHMFQNKDVVRGEVDRKNWAGKQAVVLQPTPVDPGPTTMTAFVEQALDSIYERVKNH
ncbi:P-loop containing nucleoside triphosphate hydrolase protein [Phakopsora pachyrhizi]|nr:P-loop containing nucleoside triphosphate hydrolase protein [Phakopsora pachyrhizi]